MTELYECKDVEKTRRAHTCEVCLRKIPRGLSARLHTGKYDGEFFRYYTCNTCTRLVSKYPETCIDENEGFIDSQLLYDCMTENDCKRPLQLLHKLEREGAKA